MITYKEWSIVLLRLSLISSYVCQPGHNSCFSIVCVCVSELKEYFSILQHQLNNLYKTCNFHSDQHCDQLDFYSKFMQPLAQEGTNLFWASPVTSNSVLSQMVTKSARNSAVSRYTTQKWEGCRTVLDTPDPWKMKMSS